MSDFATWDLATLEKLAEELAEATHNQGRLLAAKDDLIAALGERIAAGERLAAALREQIAGAEESAAATGRLLDAVVSQLDAVTTAVRAVRAMTRDTHPPEARP